MNTIKARKLKLMNNKLVEMKSNDVFGINETMKVVEYESGYALENNGEIDHSVDARGVLSTISKALLTND
jgi:hypothetical protein